MSSTARRQSSTTSLSRYARASSPDLANRSLDFCNAFWGAGDGGVEVMFARLRGAARTVEELRAFWKERATIEDDYAKRLVKLAKQVLGRDEIGELRNSLDTLRSETEKQASAHLQLALAMRKELEIPATEFIAKQANHKKTFHANIEKAYKAKQAQENYVDKAREKYEQDCVRINSYTAQASLVQGRDLEKVTLKLERAQQSVTSSERDYMNFQRALADTAGKWEKEWKTFCDQCQDIEEERVEFMKDNMWAYANSVSTVCVSDDESCEKLRVSLEQLEVEKDMENFVLQYGTGSNIPDPPPFINYTAPNPPPARQTFRPANYARSTTRSIPLRTTPAPEDDPGPNTAGVGSGNRGREPERAPTRSSSRANSRARSINGDYGGMAGGSSRDVRRSPDGDAHATLLTIGDAAYPITLGSSAPGGTGDPMVRALEELRKGGTSGSVRRPSSRRGTTESYDRRRSSVGSALSPPQGGPSRNYQDGHGGSSRPSSPGMQRTASPVPIEQVVANYEQAFPGERSRRNSAAAPRAQPNQRAVSPARDAYGQYRSPSPGLPNPPLGGSIGRSPSPLGISLDNRGNVVQDTLAEQYKQQIERQHAQQAQTQPPYQQPAGYGGGGPGGPGGWAQQPPPPQAHPYAAAGAQPASYGAQQGFGGYGAQPQPGYNNPPAATPAPVPAAAPAAQPPNTYGAANGAYGAQYGGQQYAQPPPAHQPPPPQQDYARYQQPQQPRAPSPAPPPVAHPPPPAPTSAPEPPASVGVGGSNVLFYVKALYDYTATIDEEFDFQAGDIIAVTATPEDGWWHGELLDDTRRVPGRTTFPSNFVCLF